MGSLSSSQSAHIRWLLSIKEVDNIKVTVNIARYTRATISVNLYGAKLYLMDDGRWLILDYLNIPDAPRHHIDCIEGDVCNMNVRIVADSTKLEIERNQEIFDDNF